MSPRSHRSGARRKSRRTRLSSEEIRSRLLEAALVLIRDQGYDETPVSQLTRETGVAKGTFFNHFPTKEHILADFLGQVWSEAVSDADRAGHRGTDAIIHVLDGLMRRLEPDAVLTAAIAARLSTLPAPPTEAEGPSGLMEFWSQWLEARIDESLPVAVPLEAVSSSDLASLVAGALAETLRGGMASSGPERPSAAIMGARAVFLLRSAGFAAPDPPRPSPPRKTAR